MISWVTKSWSMGFTTLLWRRTQECRPLALYLTAVLSCSWYCEALFIFRDVWESPIVEQKVKKKLRNKERKKKKIRRRGWAIDILEEREMYHVPQPLLRQLSTVKSCKLYMHKYDETKGLKSQGKECWDANAETAYTFHADSTTFINITNVMTDTW